MFVDVHAHLTDRKYQDDLYKVIEECKDHNLKTIIVNGLDPISNRQALDLAKEFSIIKPAAGIYPVNAVNHIIKDLPFPVPNFDVDAEVENIREYAKEGKIVAIGECGLDGYWIGKETHSEQERVFISLIEISIEYDLPLIIHTRKLEQRAMTILREHKAQKVIFHCFGGKVKSAINAATNDGWWFSIPSNARKNEAFTKMLKELPREKILTETDSPYLAPEKGKRNSPISVVDTVKYLAELREWNLEQAQKQIWSNFSSLFDKS